MSRAAEHEVDGGGVVDDGEVFGLADDGGDATGGRSLGLPRRKSSRWPAPGSPMKARMSTSPGRSPCQRQPTTSAPAWISRPRGKGLIATRVAISSTVPPQLARCQRPTSAVTTPPGEAVKTGMPSI